MTHALREHAHGKRIIGARRTRPARASYIRRGIPVASCLAIRSSSSLVLLSSVRFLHAAISATLSSCITSSNLQS